MLHTDPKICQGTCRKIRGNDRGKGIPGKMKRSAVIILMSWGILFGSILNQSLEVKANGLSYQVDYDDGIPRDLREIFEVVGHEYDICPELLEAMAYRESRYIPDVTNGRHVGLMQINVKIHAERIERYGWTEDDMTDPYKNLMIAADYLHELYEKYGDDNPIVLSIYSGNWKAVNTYKEYGFMTPYVEDVLTRSAELERLHGK